MDVSELEGRIFFYGKQQGEWFDYFYQDKDAILSPNVPDVLAPGAFDGFPTASCTEAALREVAILATDPLQMNEGRFVQGEEIDILPHEADRKGGVLPAKSGEAAGFGEGQCPRGAQNLLCGETNPAEGCAVATGA